MASKDTIGRTVSVALILCIVCSLVVASAAVLLKPAQVANKAQDRKRNILAAAGMLQPGVSIDEQFEKVQTRIVDLRTGEFTTEIDPAGFEQLKAARDPQLSLPLDDEEDIASIGRRENFAEVYVVEQEGQLDKIILPVRGYGLWSTLYGFLALESDGNTIAGLGFYEHAETPGLGGEVDNPGWKALWPGKEVYQEGDVAIQLVKGSVDPRAPGSEYKVDALSGATLTSRGVTNLLHFWMGEMGYRPFLANLRSGEARS